MGWKWQDRTRLTSGASIGQSLNLCITGPTGCGKTWLACALGNQACRQGYSVRYLRVPRLFEQLRIAQGDGSYARLMDQLQKTDLLILDDWGMQKMIAPQRQDLIEVIEDRHGRGSTLIASQLPIEHWYDYIHHHEQVVRGSESMSPKGHFLMSRDSSAVRSKMRQNSPLIL
ncbi:ATP-binding protein [Halomonas sp.]|uniref:ATP-binding protein n=1 Tax=Halomonas sp. TaxID=1486246 RepID=UPI003D11D25C